MTKPLKVDEVWMDRIASLLNEMEFGSLSIIVHEGQIVQMERTERKRYENTSSNTSKSGKSRSAASGAADSRSSGPRALRKSGSS
ncbi:YezD family protein [Paenibacillus urinalis]|uniref:YezD family protein n=1 Tax=Paenibacillus urinalis TaxID=521520 RepID=A0AAX3N1U9_9BACL|nr:YezD family protein [Paenibacillus urinalis]WDH83044.1 YezD family protein [Paenibacillus urinalis]WDH99099.1 YezD family protein [Paenibacillus urinalis]WDI02789.1 YezD family protein [Paenibacillus urinalis]